MDRTASELANAVSNALTRDGHGLIEIEGYCETTHCAAREITINIKDHDSTLLEMIRKSQGLNCPVCRGPLKLHHARSSQERTAAGEVAARMDVNAQMYRRDKAKTNDVLAFLVPTAVLMDDRLPPTPTDWFND